MMIFFEKQYLFMNETLVMHRTRKPVGDEPPENERDHHGVGGASKANLG